jgi:hypothetical protein
MTLWQSGQKTACCGQNGQAHPAPPAGAISLVDHAVDQRSGHVNDTSSA